MKRTKCLIAFLLILAVIMPVFASGNSEKATEKQVLKVAGLKGAYGDEYWKQIETAFETAYPNVDVQLTIEAQVEKTITPQIQAGAGPDVLYLATGRKEQLTETMISSNALVNLTNLLTKKVYNEDVTLQDRILPSIMGNGVTNPYAGDDTNYMLPLFFSSNGLFFNADFFYDNNGNGTEDAKVDGKYEMPSTWDEFLALGKILNTERTTNAATPYLFTYPTAGYLDTMVPASIAASAGEATVKQAFNYEPIWETAEVKRVFENLGAIKDYILPTTVGNANVDGFRNNQQAIIDGKALFMTNGDWVKGEMADTTPSGFNWGSAPFLAFSNGGERFGTVNTEQIYINANTKVQSLAEDFILFLYSQTGLELIAKYGNGAFVPAKTYDEVALKAGMNAGAVAGYKGYYDGTAKVLIGSFAAANAEGVNWKQTYCETMDSVMNGSKTVNDWIQKLKTDSAKLKATL
ncbi:MAG: carbohydrate ABC transporter substrate-binding protein [Spirochaetales bacterium]|nr:carbohydrate ABC transporter substrate-binding protein [Spirochaetales bacterium]